MDRDCLAELHGNMFVDECAVCKRMFVRSGASSTVGRKMSNESCKAQNVKRPCHDWKFTRSNIKIRVLKTGGDSSYIRKITKLNEYAYVSTEPGW